VTSLISVASVSTPSALKCLTVGNHPGLRLSNVKTKIIQITASSNNEVFGLGEDNKVYFWEYVLGQWQLYKN